MDTASPRTSVHTLVTWRLCVYVHGRPSACGGALHLHLPAAMGPKVPKPCHAQAWHCAMERGSLPGQAAVLQLHALITPCDPDKCTPRKRRKLKSQSF